MSSVFVSYSHKDRSFVERLVADLDRAGLEVAYDLRIPAGPSWMESLGRALEGSRFVLAVLSADYAKSPWAQTELKMAMVQNATIVPIRPQPDSSGLAGTPVAALLSTLGAVDFTHYEEGLRSLLARLMEPGQEPGTGELREAEPLELKPSQKAALERDLEKIRSPAAAKPPPEPDPQACLVLMPFNDQPLEDIFELVVTPVVEKCDLVCDRADNVFGSNVVMDDIRDCIERARLIVADLTRRNANVFYEVGIAHALGKQVLLMAQSMEDVPFDLRHRRVLLYTDSIRGGKQLEQDLEANLRAMLNSGGRRSRKKTGRSRRKSSPRKTGK